jgi:hypothetical protein
MCVVWHVFIDTQTYRPAPKCITTHETNLPYPADTQFYRRQTELDRALIH